MKVGILGDIHGNDSALNAVLNAASSAGVKQWLNAGDVVGYYFAPRRVMEMLNQLECRSVRGNHEEMLCRARDDADYLLAVEAKYGCGLRVALEQLSAQQVNDLCGLPHPLPLVLDGRKILLCHGAPHDIDCYVYPDGDLSALDARALAVFDVVVTGHTHYPMQRVLGEKTLLINPGSVGQPRNRQPGAHWALYDTESGEVSFHCESYDCSPLQAEARRRHPELPYLADVLGRT